MKMWPSEMAGEAIVSSSSWFSASLSKCVAAATTVQLAVRVQKVNLPVGDHRRRLEISLEPARPLLQAGVQIVATGDAMIADREQTVFPRNRRRAVGVPSSWCQTMLCDGNSPLPPNFTASSGPDLPCVTNHQAIGHHWARDGPAADDFRQEPKLLAGRRIVAIDLVAPHHDHLRLAIDSVNTGVV